jgi:hypothetical protein
MASLGGVLDPASSYNWTGTHTFTGPVTLSGSPTLTTPVITDPTMTTATHIGAKSGSTVSVVEKGNDVMHQTVFTLTALPLTLADATQGAGVKIYDFPEGVITILGASGSVAETTTSTLASTLNTGVTYNWGVGTTTQASATLATTEQDILPVTNGTASATINVAAAASTAVRTAAPANFDGHTTAKSAFFNVGVAGATDIDGDATTTWTGTITVTWLFNGDV